MPLVLNLSLQSNGHRLHLDITWCGHVLDKPELQDAHHNFSLTGKSLLRIQEAINNNLTIYMNQLQQQQKEQQQDVRHNNPSF